MEKFRGIRGLVVLSSMLVLMTAGSGGEAKKEEKKKRRHRHRKWNCVLKIEATSFLMGKRLMIRMVS